MKNAADINALNAEIKTLHSSIESNRTAAIAAIERLLVNVTTYNARIEERSALLADSAAAGLDTAAEKLTDACQGDIS